MTALADDRAVQLAALALQSARTAPEPGDVAAALTDAGWLAHPHVLADVVEVLAHECRRQRAVLLEVAHEIRTVVADVTSRDEGSSSA
ncbi:MULTISPECIES: hypothetical protein [unclassified Nocardioides]|uniref:hypothetical protein n=1 Tax=unclassified Nocardioides TaxID=2615069 RepID=UPI000702C473|nr:MULTISPECIES: hypothetical protein [unclassified Nocardioides]KRC53937.1 hypothetical protein ASE19_07605 [Nocardioides sp. Root79]KRC71273.1 hypothetical protein ASE20_10020 [Nocardioides sp. Root240]